MPNHDPSKSVVIVGAGGHGREMYQALLESRVACAGFVDDRAPDPDLMSRLGSRWLGPLSEMKGLRQHPYLLGVGSGETRRHLDQVVSEAGCQPATLIHPMSAVGTDVSVSAGVVVFAFATVTTNISLGRHTHIGRGCAVGHDATLGDYVSLYPLSAVSGNVTVGSESTVGTNACVRQGLTIGGRVFIGAGAAVVHDLPDDIVAVGVPARVRGRDTPTGVA